MTSSDSECLQETIIVYVQVFRVLDGEAGNRQQYMPSPYMIHFLYEGNFRLRPSFLQLVGKLHTSKKLRKVD